MYGVGEVSMPASVARLGRQYKPTELPELTETQVTRAGS